MAPSDGRPSGATPTKRTLPWVLVVALFVVFAAAGPIKMAARRTPKATTSATTTGSTVKMAGLKFAPASLTVPRGTEVLFDNDDVAPHTVTGDAAGSADSGILNPGKTFRFVVKERFVHHCDIHPFMKATIEVS